MKKINLPIEMLVMKHARNRVDLRKRDVQNKTNVALYSIELISFHLQVRC